MNIEKLRDSRKQKGLSQEDLANICNVSRQAVSKWESGQSVPETDKLVLLSKALDVSVDYLLDNEDMQESRVRVKLDYEELSRIQSRADVYEYQSKTRLLGLPLVHIKVTRNRGYRRTKMQVAKGIIAIGDVAIGFLSIGIFSLGFMSFGLMGLGLLGLSIIQAAIFSFGIVSIGFSAVGIVAIGIYSLGILSLGKVLAVGIVSFGDFTIGIESFGRTTALFLGKSTDSQAFCELNGSILSELSHLLRTQWLPYPLKAVVQMLMKC